MSNSCVRVASRLPCVHTRARAKWLWFSRFYDKLAWCQFFGVKSCSSGFWKIVKCLRVCWFLRPFGLVSNVRCEILEQEHFQKNSDSQQKRNCGQRSSQVGSHHVTTNVGMKDGAFTSVRWLWHTRGVIATPTHPTNVGGDKLRCAYAMTYFQRRCR